MTYTNAELIAIVQDAKKNHLKRERGGWNGYCQSTYVCHAIRNAMEKRGQRWTIPPELQALVDAHIGSVNIVDTFLEKKFGRRKFKTMTFSQIQDWRALLMDNMVKILQKEGKK